ncbi:MAG: alpha/beta hydrolase [Deltaproteobacteria bacterium]|nr:alpha/beta hydrolase [Deltaproteobacteria bacterium]
MDRLIFHPDPVLHQTPAAAGLAFDDLFFTTEDNVRLHGWFVRHPKAMATLIWFHGNAGNISHRVENLKMLHERIPINIFIFDYRGYGQSGGSVSEAGTYKDGEAAIRFLKEKYNVGADELIIFGRSLGAAVAAEMANRFESMAVILESPFASIQEMARAILPFLPLGSLTSTRYATVEKVRGIKAPLLILHGDRDEVVPFSQGKQVFAAALVPKTFYTIAGAGHNDTYFVGGERYYQAWRQHIEAAHRRRRAASAKAAISSG